MSVTERIAVIMDVQANGIASLDKVGNSAQHAADKVRAAAESNAAAQTKVRLAEVASRKSALNLAAAKAALAKVQQDSTATSEQTQHALLKVQTAEIRAAEGARLLGTAQQSATRAEKAHSRALVEQAASASVAGSAITKAKINTDGLARAIRGGVVTAAAAGGAAVAVFGIKAVSAASDLSESTSKAGVVFGDSANAVTKFAATAATSLGQSRAAATEAAGTFGNLFVAMGIGQAQSADLSTSLVGLASDLASFNNSSPEDALEALRAGLLGEAEPLRKFGVQLSAARVQEEGVRLGLIKQANDVMPAAAKAQASYAIIMKDTTVAQGDFSRTSSGLANQQRILTAQFQDFAATAGGIALPAATKLFGAVNDLLGPVTALIGSTGGAGKAVRDFGLSFIALAGGLGLVKKAMDLAAGSSFGSKLRDQFTQALSGASEAAALSGRSVGAVTKVGAGLGALAKAVGPVGLALSVGAGLLAVFGQRSTEADGRVADLTKSIQEQGGEISKNNRETAAKILADKGLLEASRLAGIDTRLLTSAYLGNQDARKKVNDAVDAGLAIASKDIGAGKAQRTQTAEQIKAYIQLSEQFPGLLDDYDKSSEAQSKVAAATEDVTVKTTTWTSVAEDAKEKLDAQKAAADRLKISIDILTGANIDVTQAQIGYVKAQETLAAGVKETIEDNKKKARGDRESATSLDVNTAAGQRNLTNITALAQAAGSYATATASRSNSEEAGRVVMEKARAAFVAQAIKIGFTRAQVDKLTAAYFRVPKYVPTEIQVKIAAALREAARIQRTIKQVRGKVVTIQVNQDGGIQRVQREINSITGKAVSITVNPGSTRAKTGNAAGGWLRGGVAGRDSIPLANGELGMPGEFVVSRSAARANADLLEAINAGSVSMRTLKLPLSGQRSYASAGGAGGSVQLDPADRALLRQVAAAAGRPVEISGELRARGTDLVASVTRVSTDRARR